MERRAFLTQLGTIILILPAARLISGCGTSSPTPSNPPSGPTSTPPPGQLTFTSSVVLDHTHTFGIMVTAISSPPAAGRTTSGHSHVVTLSQMDLQTIEGGGTVTSTTSSAEGHTHTFTFSNAGGSMGGTSTGGSASTAGY
jgi:hypothetical protein